MRTSKTNPNEVYHLGTDTFRHFGELSNAHLAKYGCYPCDPLCESWIGEDHHLYY